MPLAGSGAPTSLNACAKASVCMALAPGPACRTIVPSMSKVTSVRLCPAMFAAIQVLALSGRGDGAASEDADGISATRRRRLARAGGMHTRSPNGA